jgi:hypothetical protein
MFQPDFVSETFEPGTETGGSDGNGRAVRYLEWRWVPESRADMNKTDMAYLLRDEKGSVEVIYDRHFVGLFPYNRVAGADRGRRLRASRGPLRAQLAQRHGTRGVPRAATCRRRRGVT